MWEGVRGERSLLHLPLGPGPGLSCITETEGGRSVIHVLRILYFSFKEEKLVENFTTGSRRIGTGKDIKRYLVKNLLKVSKPPV